MMVAFHDIFLITIDFPVVDADRLEKLPPHLSPSKEIQALKSKMSETIEHIRGKNSNLTVQDLKRLLFRCAATLISLNHVSAHHWLQVYPDRLVLV
jgi:phosphatidylinositol 4-kinase A